MAMYTMKSDNPNSTISTRISDIDIMKINVESIRHDMNKAEESIEILSNETHKMIKDQRNEIDELKLKISNISNSIASDVNDIKDKVESIDSSLCNQIDYTIGLERENNSDHRKMHVNIEDQRNEIEDLKLKISNMKNTILLLGVVALEQIIVTTILLVANLN